MFRTIIAISGQGCPEKPALSPDDELRAVAWEEVHLSEHLDNPFDEADSM